MAMNYAKQTHILWQWNIETRAGTARERAPHTHSCHEAIMNIKADWARDDNKLMIIPRSGYAGQTSNTHTTHEQEKVMS